MTSDLIRRAVFAAALLCAGSYEASAWQHPKAQPSSRVETCPAMGAGYVKIAGTETCIKLDGSIRIEAARNSGGASYGVDAH